MKAGRYEMLAIRHMGIYVTDMDKMLTFYESILGMEQQVHTVEESVYISTVLGVSGIKVDIYKLKAADGNLLELLKVLSPDLCDKPASSGQLTSPGSVHLAITVSNADIEYERLTGLGITFISPPCICPEQTAKVCFCIDPEGNFLELVEVLK